MIANPSSFPQQANGGSGGGLDVPAQALDFAPSATSGATGGRPESASGSSERPEGETPYSVAVGTPTDSGGEAPFRPPLTNRGVVAQVDYLKVTIWDSWDRCTNLIYSSGLIDYLSPNANEFQDVDYAGGRVFQVKKWLNELFIIGYIENSFPCNYYTIELKGEGCSKVGLAGLQRFLTYLRDTGIKFRCSRLDIAFDYCPFTPRKIRAACKRGDIRSRCYDVSSLTWYVNEEGSTCYLGKRDAAYYLRCYDRRGYTRFELQLRDTASEKYCLEFLRCNVDLFTPIAVSWARGMVDFVDRKSATRIENCKHLSWWSAFVADAQKCRVANVQRESRPFPERYKLERSFQSMSYLAQAAIDAFGSDWFLDQMKKLSASRPDRVQENEELLKRNIELWVTGFQSKKFYGDIPF